MLRKAFSIAAVALALAFSHATSSKATTFFEQQDTGRSIANASKILGDSVNKIRGSLSSPTDIDLYQIEFDRDTNLQIDLYQSGFIADKNGNHTQHKSGSLYLFNSNGEAVKAGFNSLTFTAVAKQKLYLGISNGLKPLDRQGQILLDPKNQKISNGKLANWENLENGIQVPTNYEISIVKHDNFAAISEAEIVLGISLLMLSFWLNQPDDQG